MGTRGRLAMLTVAPPGPATGFRGWLATPCRAEAPMTDPIRRPASPWLPIGDGEARITTCEKASGAEDSGAGPAGSSDEERI
jgi:hypothetical protein